MGEQRSSDPGALPRYLLPDDALEYGASLGNAHCWLTTRGSGSIQEFFSVATGAVISGTVVVRYCNAAYPLMRASAESVAGQEHSGVLLPQLDRGEMELHPAYQRRRFSLPGALQVSETVFVPLTGDDDPAVAYYHVALVNRGAAARSLRLFAFARLGGTFDVDVTARYEPERRAFVAADRRQRERVRLFGCSEAVAAYEAGHDFGRAYDLLHAGPPTNTVDVPGDLVGTLAVDLVLQPDEQREISFLLAFAPDGERQAIAVYDQARDVARALDGTIAYVTERTAVAQVLTPDRTVNAGVLWSKVNMLRVMARYPTGPAFTNDPGNSSNVVARDAAWFVYGNDHLRPDFSRTLLDTFARLQQECGKIIEYYNALDGSTDDYGLNINDDTPLFVLAVNHHYRATGDSAWLRRIYPAVARAAHYITSQRDERGLVFCTSRDPRGNLWAIACWRNIIPHYTLNGAVTEINAECVAALRAAAHLAENLGDQDDDRQTFLTASDALRAAMNQYLINPANGMYYLNIDADGIAHTDVTGDQVFPVIFRACDEATGFHIIRRLNYPDFWTVAGLRTLSSQDLLYDPAHYWGLLGGVWPGLSWWYAFAAARYHPEIMVRALTASFAHYAANPKANNTVPGQFGEWFDGESLTNRGMRLSPWEPPRFLWAAVEGICGVVLQPGTPKIQPLVPDAWR
ncbi:MAG TPA: amylo-alpha-1,6-glucosidase, partial [Chloroflexota bacterium]|nr:amylo-alpha-1,6-glucosidase [Chloroflexota bacterium]